MDSGHADQYRCHAEIVYPDRIAGHAELLANSLILWRQEPERIKPDIAITDMHQAACCTFALVKDHAVVLAYLLLAFNRSYGTYYCIYLHW